AGARERSRAEQHRNGRHWHSRLDGKRPGEEHGDAVLDEVIRGRAHSSRRAGHFPIAGSAHDRSITTGPTVHPFGARACVVRKARISAAHKHLEFISQPLSGRILWVAALNWKW